MSDTIEAAAPAGTAETTATATIIGTSANDAPEATPPLDTGSDGMEEPEAQASGDDTPNEESATPEEVELAFGAKTLKVAKGAIPETVLSELTEFTKGVQADYTRKTQEVAETRKALEVEREFLSVASQLQGDKLRDFAEGQVIARDLQALQAHLQQNGRSLWESNPDQARQLSDRVAMLQAELAQKVDAVSRHEAEIKRANEQFVAKQIEAGRAAMAQRVKGFDAAGEKALTEYAASRGIPPEQANQWALNPIVAEAFWKAMQFDRQQATVKAAVAAKQAPAPAPAPVKSVAGKSTQATGAHLSDDEAFFRSEMAKAANRAFGRRR